MIFYPNSFAATMASIIGSGLIMVGILAPIGGDMPIGVGIFFLLMGIGLLSIASNINRNKAFKRWLKRIKEDGADDIVRESTAGAVKVYNAFPDERTLAYIEELNPEAAEIIKAYREKKKKSK